MEDAITAGGCYAIARREAVFRRAGAWSAGRHGIGARMARARAGERDQAGQDRAEQRQEDDRLIHAALSPSSD